MNNKVLLIFTGIGIIVTISIIEVILSNLWDKFKRWRKNGCKIKILCKPHAYQIWGYWPKSEEGELILKCSKCGKCKKVYIDTESFENWRCRQEETIK